MQLHINSRPIDLSKRPMLTVKKGSTTLARSEESRDGKEENAQSCNKTPGKIWNEKISARANVAAAGIHIGREH
jgi:hypothetical protein